MPGFWPSKGLVAISLISKPIDDVDESKEGKVGYRGESATH